MFGSALVPDFQQFYGLRLVDVVRDWDPAEAMLLVAGLPDSSRYAARRRGYEGRTGWDDSTYLLLDLRNAVEALRSMYAVSGTRRKPRFREWKDFPGHAAQQRRERARRMASIRRLAQQTGGEVR